MTDPTVLLDVSDGVALVTLHWPEVRNAFGGGIGRELNDAFERCDVDDAIRVVVVTGTPPAFCSGADLSSGGNTFEPRDPESFAAAVL